MDAYYVPIKPKTRSGLKTVALVVGVILFMYGFMYGFWVWGHAKQGSMPGYIYRDSLIIGKTEEEIIAVYGEPDHRFWYNEINYDINCILSGQCYHAIIFEDGVAVKIERHLNGYP